jgi:endonuclease G
VPVYCFSARLVRVAARLAFLLVLLFSRSVQAGPLDACREHLPDGPPSVVVAAQTTEVCHAGYALLHDDDFLIARWVAYRLMGDLTFGCVDRTNNFHMETALPRRDRRSRNADYEGSGYDRGHLAAAQDFAWDLGRMRDSFSMANMTPQVPGLNQKQWERLEETVRSWASDRKELIVYVGPIVLNPQRTIGRRHVVVPTAFWKVIMDRSRGEALAFIMPQEDIAKGRLEPWQASIDSIERAAGIKLPLPPGLDATAIPKLWVTDLAVWRRKKEERCPE